MTDFTADMQLLSVLTDDPYRPAVVTCLAERSPPVPLSDLATAVEAQVDEFTVEENRPEIDLHHVHLPLLSDFDLISYDAETNTVDYDVERLEQLLSQYHSLSADGVIAFEADQRLRSEPEAERSPDRLSSPQSSDRLDG